MCIRDSISTFRPMAMETRCSQVIFPNYSKKKPAEDTLVPPLRREGIVFLRRDHDPEISDSRASFSSSSSSSSSAQSMLQPTGCDVTTLPRPAAAGNAMRVWQIRAVICRVALSNLRYVPHHIYLCWSYILLQQLHVACMHVAAHPCTGLPSQAHFTFRQ